MLVVRGKTIRKLLHRKSWLDFGMAEVKKSWCRVLGMISITYPQEGIPILYHDQMNVIAKHVAEIKDNMEEQGDRHQRYLEGIVPTIAAIKSTKKKAKITRRILKVQRDQ